MWDNLILRDKKGWLNRTKEYYNLNVLEFLKKKAFSLFWKEREKNERSLWSIVWVIVCILYCVVNVCVQMNE